MDPNENLREQLKLAAAIEAYGPDCDPALFEQRAKRLAELVLAMHDWIRNGGILPQRWDSERMQEIRTALTDISTLIADPNASPTFTYSNLCEARSIAREALARIFPVDFI